jgi:hypothetical protein
MLISLNGPSVEEFNPSKAVDHWNSVPKACGICMDTRESAISSAVTSKK